MHFERAIKQVLDAEGGYVNDPRDAGGETKYGISKHAYPQINIRELTIDQAKAIYRRDYWDKHNLDMIVDGDLAAAMFKLIVNIGGTRGVKLIQEAVNRSGGEPVDCDGKMGPATIEAVNTYPNHEYLLCRLRLTIIEWYVEHSRAVFLKGLIKRALG